MYRLTRISYNPDVLRFLGLLNGRCNPLGQNLDFLSKNLGFLLKNDGFLLNKVDFITKTRSAA